MEDKNPVAFWKLVNQLKNKKSSENLIDAEIWQNYFQELHNNNSNKNFDTNFEKFIFPELPRERMQNMDSTRIGRQESMGSALAGSHNLVCRAVRRSRSFTGDVEPT